MGGNPRVSTSCNDRSPTAFKVQGPVRVGERCVCVCARARARKGPEIPAPLALPHNQIYRLFAVVFNARVSR